MGHQEGELGLERVGVGLGREVAAELVARLTDRVRDAVHDLADAFLALLGVTVEPGLTEVLRDDDVRRELAPGRRDLGPFHLEDDRAVGVRDDRGAALVDELGRLARRRGEARRSALERVDVRAREHPRDRHAACAAGLAALVASVLGLRLTVFLLRLRLRLGRSRSRLRLLSGLSLRSHLVSVRAPRARPGVLGPLVSTRTDSERRSHSPTPSRATGSALQLLGIAFIAQLQLDRVRLVPRDRRGRGRSLELRRCVATITPAQRGMGCVRHRQRKPFRSGPKTLTRSARDRPPHPPPLLRAIEPLRHVPQLAVGACPPVPFPPRRPTPKNEVRRRSGVVQRSLSSHESPLRGSRVPAQGWDGPVQDCEVRVQDCLD